MKKYTFIGLVLVAALAIGCTTHNPVGTVKDFPSTGSHQYQYTGRDENGAVIVQGWLKLDLGSDNRVSGTWNLASANGQTTTLPLGSGILAGEIDRKSRALTVNLHPQMADNNLMLSGTFQNNELQGNWSWITFVGPTKGGTFTAKK